MPVAEARAAVAGLHVLLTCDTVGGVWTYALDLARGLGRLGACTTLVVLGPAPSRDQSAEAEAVAGLGLLVSGLPLDWTVETRDAALAANADLAALAARTGAELVHLHGPALAAGARYAAPVVATCHSCVRTWWDAVRGTPLPADFAWRAELVREGCLSSDVLTAPTRAFAEATSGAYGLSRRPVVVRNGRAPALLTPPASAEARTSEAASLDADLRPAPHSLAKNGKPSPPRAGDFCANADALPSPSRGGAGGGGLDGSRTGTTPIPGGAPRLLGPPRKGEGSAPGNPCKSLQHGEVNGSGAFAFTAGRLWDEGKGVAVLDAAAALCGIPVLAAGPLEGPNGVRIALRHAVSLGRLAPEAVAGHLATRPIFVSSALYEPFGLSVLEAAGAGCPLVLSDIATFRELWEGAARFVDPRDPAVLASALRTLATDPGERGRLGVLAAERAKRYGLDAFVAGTVAVYRDVLGSGRAGARADVAA